MSLKTLITPFAKRYIAGETREDALKTALSLSHYRLFSAIDHLGEEVTDETRSRLARDEYISLLDDISKHGLPANVSLKLTHMGLKVSDELTIQNVEAVIKKALELKNSVRFDMEGSQYTQKTLDITFRFKETYDNVGTAIQSYLKRSAGDIRLLIEKGVSVRLVKGAYKEPPDIAYPDKKDVDKNFSALMKELLLKGNQPAIATHDERLIEEAKRFAEQNNIPKGSFDFEFLLGIKNTLQKHLAREGYRIRVYVPYGADWLAYMTRRLGERKENIFFIIKNILD
ncbi:MAG: proline dehydrogenase family protein [Deltaproteobacteria bacterium]|nr:proline dehydrogenase family protein [Deltaproteobacteria bacterium]